MVSERQPIRFELIRATRDFTASCHHRVHSGQHFGKKLNHLTMCWECVQERTIDQSMCPTCGIEPPNEHALGCILGDWADAAENATWD